MRLVGWARGESNVQPVDDGAVFYVISPDETVRATEDTVVEGEDAIGI